VLADAATVGYDAVLCLGDLVGYGADPVGVMERTFALNPAAVIRGNHDKVCAGLEPPILFNEMARQSVTWTQATLSPQNTLDLKALPAGPRTVAPGVEICHGAPFDEDHYVFDQEDAERAIRAMSVPLCLFGHTHLPAIFTSADDPVRRDPGLAEDEYALPRSGPALINVGSVGQPRDGDPRAAYGILDAERRTIRLRRVMYDIRGAQKKIIEAGLPAFLALRLQKGQ
jgi:diadenosine tetraphosphatase ApaH/serine/threonine PP2A family protein phosphatase